MGILSITTFVSLDGVMQAPGGATEDTAGRFAHGGWVIPHFDAPMGAFMSEVFSRAGAFLLGRGTYNLRQPLAEGDRPRQPHRGPAQPPAQVRHTSRLVQADWAGSTVVRDPVAALAGLTAGLDGELQVHGSASLAASLLHAGVVDALNLLTFPVVLGAGKRLFPRTRARPPRGRSWRTK